ncbi:hypothetical protein FOPG_10033 [Fusarium oxysporum f. sp. conglutinans race 2 54008]|uniref:Uncharacterized protein n=2 Tax=Fusarium oxysporum f. sp. conglutinans TaxID=100902 RepID=F9FKI0_FUSOF|nr:hypothetical protein FOXB_06909 [Fusarium oxysporum f. sp. conglutinans Fo5176]EXL74920.1 hypothetical protein FOPG_10033 [Fusarium oxysporum f. sp. conglutinans race 2 54008]KAG6986239.1 hypothetical protein FocnCong_v004616 [Fusarium oxysporum f. sp. conglutinans]
MASAAYDHSKVDALNLSSRRIHMEAFFKHLGLWNSDKVAKTREKCVEMFCQLLNKHGYTSINQQYFEYEVDALVWYNILKRGKVLSEANRWPWSETIPKKVDVTTPASLVYRDWLCRKSRAEGGDGGETIPPKPSNAQEHQIPAAPVTAESSKASQGPESTTARVSQPSVAPQDQASVPWRTRKTQLDSAEKRAAQQKKAEEMAAKQQLAQNLFDAELAKIEALKHEASKEETVDSTEAVETEEAQRNGADQQARNQPTLPTGFDWAADAKETPWLPPYVDPKDPVPFREDFGIHNFGSVKGSALPSHSLCETIWWKVIDKPRGGPLLNPFELALPDWLDFHDLILHDFHKIATNKLIDEDIVIAWRVEENHPVSLIVGPSPLKNHAEGDIPFGLRVRSNWLRVAAWIADAYRGSPVRLVDYLWDYQRWVVCHGESEPFHVIPHLQGVWQDIIDNPEEAAAAARMNRENMDKWLPEVHAILTQSRDNVESLLENWVRREGNDHTKGRTIVARDAWARVALSAAYSWFYTMMSKDSNN